MNEIYLIGLGNPGKKYFNTRHNIGFDVLDSIAKENDQTFSVKRYGISKRYLFCMEIVAQKA